MLERIRRLCQKKGISIAKLERDLGFANGSIAKSDEKIQSYRLHSIAEYFHVSMEYILYGKTRRSNISRLIDIIADVGYEICDSERPEIYFDRDSRSGDLDPEIGDGIVYEIAMRLSDDMPPVNPVYWEADDFFDVLKKVQTLVSNEINGIKEEPHNYEKLIKAYNNASDDTKKAVRAVLGIEGEA